MPGAGQPATGSAGREIAQKTLAADQEVEWNDREKTQPMFIPERLLNGTIQLDQLPLDSLVRRDLHDLLRPVASAGDASSCRHMTHMLGVGPPRGGSIHSLEDYLAGKPLQVIGRVTKVEKGLFFWPQNVASMVQVHVDEVVRDDSRTARAGTDMHFFILGGTLSINGSMMCVDDGNPPFQAKLDQRLYVVGLDSAVDSRLITGGVPFPISGDRLVDAGYDQITMAKPMTLQEARERGRKGIDNAPGTSPSSQRR